MGPTGPGPEILPLSASPPDRVLVRVTIERASRASSQEVWVARGTLVRALLRALGFAPEGSAVLVGGVPWPLDRPIEADVDLVLIPTFSGG